VKKMMAIACAMMMVGCATTKPIAGSEKVRFTNTEPQGCKLLGDITGSQAAVFRTGADIETGARADLKNKASAMGGNVVQILTSNPSQSQVDGYTGVKATTMSANVCLSCAQR